MIFMPYGDIPEQAVFPQPWTQVSGNQTLSFKADSAAHPNGVELHFIHQDGGRTVPGHDLVISAVQGNFTSELGPKASRLGAGSDAVFLLRFGPEQPGEPVFGMPTPSQDVALTPGGTYYLNWRASDGGETHGQFFWRSRTGSAMVGPIPVPAPAPAPTPAPVPVPPPAGPLRIAIPAGATYIEIG